MTCPDCELDDKPGRAWCAACDGNNLQTDEDGQEYCCEVCKDGDGTVPCSTCNLTEEVHE